MPSVALPVMFQRIKNKERPITDHIPVYWSSN